MTSNNCPLNELGHRFFVFKTFETYEPMTYSLEAGMADEAAINQFIANLPDLYIKKEYAIMGCNCSAVRKAVVKSE